MRWRIFSIEAEILETSDELMAKTDGAICPNFRRGWLKA
jgi:hypothetical protein